MKKQLIICAALALACCAAAFAQEKEPKLKFSGEAKTGIYWVQIQQQGKEPETMDGDKPLLRLHNKDDAGGDEGRYRLNMDYDNGNGFGMRARIDWENWSNTNGEQPLWRYAFGYGNFFEDRMTVSVGKLGGSPWGTGGPEKWKELEQNNRGGGMRVEWKPSFMPDRGWGKLNAGFVLNYIDGDDDDGSSRTGTLLDLLQETVIGVSYTHEFFMARFAYRLDSELDRRMRGSGIYGREGDTFIYRIEEYALRTVLPGMQMWALGDYIGVFSDSAEQFLKLENWIFAQYDPPELGNLITPFTAQVRLGYDYIDSRSELHVKPSFYWHFNIGEYSKLISVGAMFSYRQDFGEGKIYVGSPYQQMEIEPKVQLNFTSSYIALVYNWKQEYFRPSTAEDFARLGGKEPTKQTQYINLRFCIYY